MIYDVTAQALTDPWIASYLELSKHTHRKPHHAIYVKYARTSPSTSKAKIIGVPIAAIISWAKSKTPSGSIRARCLISYLSLGRNQTTRTQLVLKICLKSPMIPFNGYNLWVSHRRKIHHPSHGRAWSEDLHRNPE